MNLYKILMTHAAPKDSSYAIQEYVIAESDEQVFKYLKKDTNYCYWNEQDDDNEDYSDGMTKMEYIFENKGDSTCEEKWQDLYYGSTMFDWELFKENIKQSEIDVLVKLKIVLVVTI